MISGSFLVALASTVLALVGVVVTGVQARRRLHYAAVLAMLGLLAWTIREAELMGEHLVYDGTASVFRTVHFVAVSATFLVFPVLVGTGLRLARRESGPRRRQHKALAWMFIGCVLVTTTLGTAMTLLATRVDEAPAAAGDEPGDG